MSNTSSVVSRGLRQIRNPLQLAGQKRTWRTRCFHSSRALAVVKPFVLADIGEGITEVQIIQWFVKPGARVEQFDKLCEVQSDKASVEITSRFDGVIKKLHYEQDDTAKVGKPLCDIDIEGEISPNDEALLTPDEGIESSGPPKPKPDAESSESAQERRQQSRLPPNPEKREVSRQEETRQEPAQRHSPEPARSRASHTLNIATPAVRGLLKELGVNIAEVRGTGKDGRVLKEDVHSHVASRASERHSIQTEAPSSAGGTSRSAPLRPTRPPPVDSGPQKETTVALNPVQTQMFKVMTRSLSIPQFLYTDDIDLSALSALRDTLNAHPASLGKLSFLPFIIKAVSLALQEYPMLNARLDIPESASSSSFSATAAPKLVFREKHNIGVAMDTPSGLLVPNIKNAGSRSVGEIAASLSTLAASARAGRLTTAELAGGTITVSNIGSIGGLAVSPVIVPGELAILGVGRARAVPAFADDGVTVVRRTVATFSWSADHRVIDGATMARMAQRVRGLLEEPGAMLVDLR